MDIMNFPSLEEALKEKKITSKTYERVKIAKGYIEKKYKMKKIQEEEKRRDWELITQKLNELQISDKEAESIKKAIQHKEAEYSRIKRQKMTIREFEPIAIIGKGAFGEVRICRHIQSNEIFAIKKMKKEEMHSKNQILHIRAERDVLSEAKNSWIVDLKYSFQDDNFLYLVMEYLPGGDLMTLLMAKDILTEDEARFYAAELVLAIESVHKLKCIHRDLKPDNVLIGKDGHIKLSDFGLSKKTDFNLYGEDENLINLNDNELQNILNKEAGASKQRKKRIFAYSTVGTPDYIAPEVFTMKGYGPQIDWWSLGVILFEMLIGYAPFSSENPTITCKKILNFRQFLHFSHEIQLSFEAKDLIKKLITDLDHRLGYNGADEIKNHPFFRNIDWDNIKKMTPPFIPEIQSEYDTRYFDSFPDDEPFYPETKSNPKKVNKDICFVDFTYKRGMEQNKSSIVSALEVLESIKISLNKNEQCDDKNHLRHVSALTNVKETENNLKSSIAEQTIETIPIKESIEDKELPGKPNIPEKELIKSLSNIRDLHLEKNQEIERFNETSPCLQPFVQKQSIVKSNSTKMNIEKPKDNVSIIKKESIKDDKLHNNMYQAANKPSTSHHNNILYNVYSPQGNKNIHYQDNKVNNHPKNMIINEKLNKNKETITFEEKKMVDKRNYESNNIIIEKTPKLSDKNFKSNNSNTNLISINIHQTIGDKNNDSKIKSGMSKQQINGNNHNIGKNSGVTSLSLQKKSISHKEEDNNSNSINEEISVGNVQNKPNLVDKGATKKSIQSGKVPQNQQYISTNYVKDFINSESNHKIDSKANKIPTNNQSKPQNKNSNTNNLVYSNLSVNTTNSTQITKQLSTKTSGQISNNSTKDIKETFSPGTPSAMKLKLNEKMISEKDKGIITPTVTNIKGLKIESTQSQRVSNDGKPKK